MGQTRVVTFKIDEELLERVDRVAASEGLTRSGLIRKALIQYLRDKGEHYLPIRVRRVRIS